jgi:GNAT superfamily N-acetyltransferase
MLAPTKPRKVELRPAVSADFDQFVHEPLPYRVRAFTAVRDGEILGIGGLAFLPNEAVAAFLLIKNDARRYRVALHKAGLFTMQEARRLGICRVVALAQDGIEAAAPWLLRLGFHPITVDGQTVYAWEDA